MSDNRRMGYGMGEMDCRREGMGFTASWLHVGQGLVKMGANTSSPRLLSFDLKMSPLLLAGTKKMTKMVTSTRKIKGS